MMLSERSEKNLIGVHPDLVAAIRKAASQMPSGMFFIVTDGLRTEEEQRQLVASKASRTMKSRHLTGHAVDLAVTMFGKVRWEFPLYVQLSQQIKQAAQELNIPIEWGGDWSRFKDGPHFQLPWKEYP